MTRVHGAGARYRCTLPFARSLAAEEQQSLAAALKATEFRTKHRYDRDPVDVRDVEIDSEAARVTVALDFDDRHDPAEVLGRLSGTVREWHTEHGPLAQSTRAGGEQSLASLDAAALDVDREPDGGVHFYVLAYPERPLTDEEVAVLDHATGEDAVVSPAFLALPDAVSPVYERPTERALRDLRNNLPSHVPPFHDLRQRDLFERREVGTLAVVDEAGREALAERGRAQSPHSTPDEAADSSEADA